LLKRIIPPDLLAGMDSIFQWTGAWAQFTPSVFLCARDGGESLQTREHTNISSYFKCPECGNAPLEMADQQITCPACKRTWNISGGIYDFRGDGQ
jgi:ribosomal protein S27E